MLLLPSAAAAAATPDAGTRHGAFGLLDPNSRYGQFWFPEPLRLGETDVDNEVRFDWVHQEGKGTVSDEALIEIEEAFGVTTWELEIPYERETDPAINERTQGAGSIEISVRRPIYQFVSPGEFSDHNLGAALEVALPTNSPVSNNTAAVVKVFDALRLGEHFSLQAIGGYAVLMAPGEEGGVQTCEYGLATGYSFSRQDLALPKLVSSGDPR